GVRFLALSVSDAADDVIGVIRGGARGYVTKTITGTDPALVIEAVSGPLFTRALISGAPLDEVFATRLVDLVLEGARGVKPGA
ncbi:TetR-like C-terminal domain-containing protein, partial [Streptomyces hydrogenans]|uniref:TetR-like C-terminal domain-containing protein n=1 Tax=Streptomyces hydrogenans TaxID=1873719 RepID=UPI00363EC75D